MSLPRDSHSSAVPPWRIFGLLADAFGGKGGIAQYDRHLLSSLAECRDVEEVVVAPRQGDISAKLPARVRQLPPVKGRIAYSLAVLRAARASRPIDLVLCGHLYMAPLAATTARVVSAPLWIQVHGLEAWHELSPLYRRSIETAALVTAVSRDTRRRLLRWIDIDPIRVKVLSNTFDSRFRPGAKRADLVKRHDLSDRKVLLTVSRLSPKERYKGHDRVIRALPQVLSGRPDTIYLVVGDGDDRPRLQQLAAEVGVAEKVRFVGHVSDDQLPEYFRLADVFVMPSTAEGFGIVFLEAMACGIDVIAGNQDGSLDALCDGSLGKVINPEDCEAIATAIGQTLDHPSTSSKSVERFRHELFGRQLKGLLQATLSPSS